MAKDPARVRTGRLNKQRSKSIEREWAKAFGTTRETDGRGTRQADIFLDGEMDLEIKSRLGHKGLVKLMEEAIGKARVGRWPVLGIDIRDPDHASHRYIVMERQDFIDMTEAWRFASALRSI